MDIVAFSRPAMVSAETESAGSLRRDSFFPIQDWIRILIRRRYIIIGSAIGAVLVGVIVTLLMTPKYSAIATIEVSREASKVTEFQGVNRESGVLDQEFYQTQYGLLRSRTLAERVATTLRLQNDPKFFEMFSYKGSTPAFVQIHGQYPVADSAERVREAGEILTRQVWIEPKRLSSLVDIVFTSSDATFSARVANAWSKNYIETNLERKIQATSYGRELLKEQLALQKQRLDESQKLLVTYASQQQIINLPTQSGSKEGATVERSVISDELGSVNTVLSEARADRIKAQARYEQSAAAGTSSEELANPAINTLRQRRADLSVEYQRLMTQFEPGYPAARAVAAQLAQLDKSLRLEEGRVLTSLRAEYRQNVQREQALQGTFDKLKDSYLDLRRRSIQYNIYQQEVDTNRALYDGLLQRFKEIGVAGSVGINNISIVDFADIPKKPSSPRLFLNLIIALALGIGASILAVFALEQIDQGVGDPSDVQRRLDLPLLGAVPQIEGDGTPLEALSDRKSSLTEAYLTIQTNLGFSTDHGVPRSFTVTSTRPAEGKSTTSLALATTLARIGRKVILVDGDMRSPSIHGLANIALGRGLSNFLSGDDALEKMSFPMPNLGFAVMPAGPPPPNAAELLAGHRLAVLIERLTEHYDHVVIDSPPIMGLADAPLIASRVEGVIFAVEFRGARWALVKNALGRLRSTDARVLGCVLTKFQVNKAQYGYGYDYGYGYGNKKTDIGDHV